MYYKINTVKTFFVVSHLLVLSTKSNFWFSCAGSPIQNLKKRKEIMPLTSHVKIRTWIFVLVELHVYTRIYYMPFEINRVIYISIRPDIYSTSICTCSFQGFTKSILLNCCLLILVLKNVYLSEWFDIICSSFALDF